MRIFQSFAASLLYCALALATVAGAWWLVTQPTKAASSAKPSAPATVAKVVKEEDLNSVTLTAEAEKRIGLALGEVTKKRHQQTRVYGGEVMLPPGKTLIVTAPMSGLLKGATPNRPQVGQFVKAGQVLFQLQPLLTPESKVTLSSTLADTNGQYNNAKTQAELTRIALERAHNVFKGGAGSQKQVDEAQAAHDVAVKALEAVQTRKNILTNMIGEMDQGTISPFPLTSPEDGMIRNLTAMPGQMVATGTALFEVMDPSLIWIRVPVPVTDLDAIQKDQVVRIGKLAAQAQDFSTTAQPIQAPPTANPAAATLDVYYEAANPAMQWIPGQRVGVQMSLKQAEESATVPWSAVVVDVHGNEWVYEKTGAHRYTRCHVSVRKSNGADAVLHQGPPAGTTIVIAGVQQLFGAETGFIK